MKVAMLGAGAWGTAMAQSAAPRHDVIMWSRSKAEIDALQRDRENKQFLPGVALHPQLQFTAELSKALDGCNLVVLATPMVALRETLIKLQALDVRVPLVCLSKGMEAPLKQGKMGLLAHEVARQAAPDILEHAGFGVLSGPTFAKEVALEMPSAIVAASDKPHVCDLMIEAFHSDRLRVYRNDDPIGVEVGGAVKNIMAIATGLVDGMKLGMNARAGLITRGLAEIARFGVALGAQSQTFMGLSGLGDLVLTSTGDLSRNRTVGLQLATGKSLDEILSALGHVAEGVYSARTVVAMARHLNVEMPISQAVVALLDNRTTPQQALEELMHRQAKAEWHL